MQRVRVNVRRLGTTRPRRAAAVIAVLVLLGGWPAGEARSQRDAPLFASHEPLELTLTVPLGTLVSRMRRRPEVEGTLAHVQDGSRAALEVEVTTRGFSRLELCSFPPLRLDFDRDETAGTVFEGQSDLKLVTLCKDRLEYERLLELEYLAYRIYTEVTDVGFKVRKLAMRYEDSERDEVVEAPAFFIEDIDAVAERLGTHELDVPAVGRAELEPAGQAILGVFQYLVGNTDWSATSAAEGEECCHNMGVLAPRADGAGILTVPYDFDQAGFVDAPYAEPHPRLGIRNVRQRLYRGLCIGNPHLGATIDAFNAARTRTVALLAAADLDADARDDALEYLAEGYTALNDARRRQREIVDRCRD